MPLFAASLAICILMAPAAWPQTFTGKVTEVVKGGVLLLTHGDKSETVRLAGVDCPELAQRFGPEAKKFTSDLVLDKEVSVGSVGTDSEGRTVAAVTLPDGKVLNQEILAEGMGWFYEKHPVDAVGLRSIAAKAIAAKKGLWIDPAPLAPWDFRGDARKEKDVLVTAAPAEPKTEVKTISAKGNLEGVEREVFPKPQPSNADVSKYLNDPLAKQLGISIHKGANGKVDGIQAGNLSAFPLAGVFGFQDGDIVQSVNGDMIDSEARIGELYEKYKGARVFNVVVIRNGQPRNIPIDISMFMK